MTPEQREQSESDIIRQYSATVQCLGFLYHETRESLRLMSIAFSIVDRGLGQESIPEECLAAADKLRAIVEDYRETHDKGTRLREVLSNLSVIKEVPHPRF